MTSSQQSPVMVDASPPSHPFQVSSSDYALSILSPTMSNRSPSAETSLSTTAELPLTDNSQAQPAREVGIDSQDVNDRPQVQPTQAEQPPLTAAAPETLETPESDESSNSESTSSTTATSETARTVSTPQSAPQENPSHIPADSSTQLDEQPTDQAADPGALLPAAPDATATDTADQSPAEEQPSTDDHAPPPDSLETPPPPVEPEIPVPEHIPSWVQYEEDTSVPDEAELKEIESDKHELNATNTNAVEKDVFTDLDDPDLRPCKKIRLSWTIKGVRGTRERPNRARIMVSPAVQVDNHFWTIKFFPRGNKSRTALSAYIRCTPTKPDDTKEDLEGSFKCYVGEPADDLSKTDPILDLTLVRPDPPVADSPEPNNEADKTPVDNPTAEPAEDQPEPAPSPDQDDDDDSSMSGDEDEDERPESPVTREEIEDYRVSAQLGVAIYNPEEPRTVYTSSASHQFYPHHDDWGWDTAVSHWEDIHRRKRGQRQALLRNDTLVIDAYVRIIDDPTKALYWHSCKEESQWDSKGLAGVFPMGTRLLYHSPATAGIAAWSQLAPFRECLQSIDVSSWRGDSSLRPKPLISHLQVMLFQMRNMKKDELYIHIDSVIHEISRSGESFDNVFTFWDTFRRAIEIESHNDQSTISALTQIFGPRQQFRALPKLPIKGVSTFADAAEKAFTSTGFQGDLPDFLPLSLDRQGFDESKRQWQLYHDRVRISEELDLSHFTTRNDGHYTLYGLIVHDGDRGSSKFFSVLRPHGPGGQWLVFSDGNGNKVFSYTRKRIEQYEGLEGEELKKLTSTRQTIHTAMYVRTKCLPDYLKSEMEPFKLPSWLKPHIDEAYNHNDDIFTPDEEVIEDAPIPVEIFWDRSVNGQEGKLDLLKLKTNKKAREPEFRQKLTANPGATMAEVYAKMSTVLGINDALFKLWAMNYHRLGGLSKGYMYVLPRESMISSCLNTSKYLSLWFTIVPHSCEIEPDILVANFLKLDGIHIEAPPKPPTPVVEESQSAAAATEGSAEIPTASGNQQASDDHVTEAVPDAEQASVSEAVQRDVSTDGPTEESTPAEPHEGNAFASGEDISTTDASAVDAEQGSVANAVAGDTQRATEAEHEVIPVPSEQSQPTSAQDNAGQNESSPPDTSENAPSSDRPEAAPAIQAHGLHALADTVDSLAEPAGQTATPQPVTPSEPQSSTPTAIASGTHATTEIGTVTADVPTEVSEVLSQHDAPLSHGTASIPVGIPIAVGQDQIILLQPAQQEDISAEDAALIQQMIAADLAAAEHERIGTDDALNQAETNETTSAEQEEAVESRPSTPRQLVGSVYGFLHVFDAEGQKFTAHSTFMEARDVTISSMVRKQMGYGEDKSFHLWKREGTYRTSGVSLESTFQDASLTDCCEVVVGDHLGESKMEALKSEAKYIDPGQLMRYLAMVEREHPIASVTSTDDVQIAEFGADHYRGPLVRGQRHGKKCLVITQGGDTYEGPLVAGQKSGGKGKMIYQNGDVYDGDWLDDMKHGQGEFVEKRTGNRYVGGYENDKRWGKGMTYWEQADQQAALCQVCYFEEVDALFYKCGHVVACYTCARQCATDANGCPVCRKPIEAVVKMYRS